MTRDQFMEKYAGETDASDALLAARWVSHSKVGVDDNELEKDYRQIRKTDPVKFHTMLGDMEAALERNRALKAKDAQSSSGAEDVGTDKAVALCEQLIREELEKIRAEKPPCPHCGKQLPWAVS